MRSIASTGMSFPSFLIYTKPYVAAASTKARPTSSSGRVPDMSITGTWLGWPVEDAIAIM